MVLRRVVFAAAGLALLQSGALAQSGKIYRIGVGRPYTGWRVVLLVAGREVRIVGLDGSPLRHFILDPTKNYQPMP